MPPLFPADAFAGTAAGYLAGRPPYPAALWDDLFARAPASPDGRLLDLACGPGRIALALADRFADIWAVDLEPEMTAAGQAEAASRGVDHIRWQVGPAETFVAPDAHFSHLAIGEAFHRLDQPRVAAHALRWLRPGGAIAIVGHTGPLGGDEPWQRLVVTTANAWRARAAVAPSPSVSVTQPGVELLLRQAGFIDIVSVDFEAPRRWPLAAVLAYLRTTSFASRHALGPFADAFEADLSARLMALDPSGAYDEIECFGYTFGRRPLKAGRGTYMSGIEWGDRRGDRPFQEFDFEGRLVQRALQAFADAEAGRLRGRAFHAFARARVAGRTGRALHGHEAAKADQAHFVARLQRSGHRVDERLQGVFRLGLVEPRLFRDRGDQFSLCHRCLPADRREGSLAPPIALLARDYGVSAACVKRERRGKVPRRPSYQHLVGPTRG
jgi:SAM-dependent methyltransferase